MTVFVDPHVIELLEGGALPTPPPSLEPDGEAIVGVWRDGSVGAVMTISRDSDDSDADVPGVGEAADDDDWPWNVEITAFEKVDGVWEWVSAGGSDWPVPYGARPELTRPALTGFASGVGRSDNETLLWSGIAPPGITQVRVTVGDAIREVPVEPVTGAFIVSLDYPAPPPDAFVGTSDR